jgi:hypothetical protein
MAFSDNKQLKIALIDAGGVLVKRTNDKKDGFRKMISGANDGLKELKKLGFTLILCSFCGKKTAKNNLDNIDKYYSDLFDFRIIVKTKPAKVAIARRFSATVLIDDTWNPVLKNCKDGYMNEKGKVLVEAVPLMSRILFTQDYSKSELKKINIDSSDFLHAPDWKTVVELCSKIPAVQFDPDYSVDIYKYIYKEFSTLGIQLSA